MRVHTAAERFDRRRLLRCRRELGSAQRSNAALSRRLYFFFPNRPRFYGAVDNRGRKPGEQRVGARNSRLPANEFDERAGLWSTNRTAARKKCVDPVFMRARIDNAPFAPDLSAAHERIHMPQQCGPVAGTACVRMTQYLLECKSFTKLFPNQ